MKTFKVTMEDGNTFVTGFNGTYEDAVNYYVGHAFEMDELKPMVTVVKVEELI